MSFHFYICTEHYTFVPGVDNKSKHMQISLMKRKEWNITFEGSAFASFVVCFLQPSFLPPQALSEKQENGNVVFLKVDVDDAQVSHPMSFFSDECTWKSTDIWAE